MELETIVDVQGLTEPLKREWNALAKTTHSTPFQLFEFQKAWLDMYCNAHTKPHILLMREQGALIGIAPLIVSENVTYFIGEAKDPLEMFDYCDVLFHPEHIDALKKSFWNVLKEKKACLKEIPTHSPLLSNPPSDYQSAMHSDISAIPLPGTWNTYVSMLGPSTRKNLRNQLNRYASEDFALSAATSDEKASEMELFFRLHNKRRSSQGGGCFADTPQGSTEKAFHRLLADALTSQNIFISKLSYQGHPLSIIYGYEDNENIYYYLSGFDENLAKQSPLYNPGLLHTFLVVKQSIESGKKKFDFMRGSETYKNLFKPTWDHTYKIETK
jgi:CelD/BcsL family acetyltransferase involved in cellulose biosynthesis